MINKKLEEKSIQIEKLRKQLNELAKDRPLSDPEILETSQNLDVLLNEYNLLNNKKS